MHSVFAGLDDIDRIAGGALLEDDLVAVARDLTGLLDGLTQPPRAHGAEDAVLLHRLCQHVYLVERGQG